MAASNDLLTERATKLPFWKTVGRSYSVFFRNIATALRGTWLLLLLTGAVSAAVAYVQFGALRLFLEGPQPPGAPTIPLDARLLVLTLNAFVIVGGASCAVMWHRFLLLGERPALSGSNIASGYDWRYVWTIILIMASAILLALPIGAGAAFLAVHGQVNPHDPLLSAAMIAAIIVSFCAILVAARLALLLPARAIGDHVVTFRRIWAATKGNSWRLFWGCALTFFPPVSVLQILFGQSILTKLAPIPGHAFRVSQEAFTEIVASQAVGAIFTLFSSLVMIGFLSFSYQFFFASPVKDPLFPENVSNTVP